MDVYRLYAEMFGVRKEEKEEAHLQQVLANLDGFWRE